MRESLHTSEAACSSVTFRVRAHFMRQERRSDKLFVHSCCLTQSYSTCIFLNELPGVQLWSFSGGVTGWWDGCAPNRNANVQRAVCLISRAPETRSPDVYYVVSVLRRMCRCVCDVQLGTFGPVLSWICGHTDKGWNVSSCHKSLQLLDIV